MVLENMKEKGRKSFFVGGDAVYATFKTNMSIIFTNPSVQAGYDTRSIFKQSFPSPRLVASPRLKNPVCPTIYP